MSENDDPPAEDVRQAAIEWWVSHKAGLTQEEQASFEAWLAADPAHAAVFADIAQTFEHVKRVRRVRPARRSAFISRQHWLTGGAAALAAAFLAFYVLTGGYSPLQQPDFATGMGETKTLMLSDGSQIMLDASSAIAVALDPEQRRVRLLKGQGWFEATPDSARPFVVEAAGGTVTALGTAFGVDLIDGRVRVSVAEHQVRVWSGGANVVVAENEQTAYDAHSPPAEAFPIGRSSIAAWRRGKLIVEDRPLGEVLTELRRYRSGFVYCVPTAICARPVTGVFSTRNPLEALHEIEVFLGLRAVYLTDFLILLYD